MYTFEKLQQDFLAFYYHIRNYGRKGLFEENLFEFKKYMMITLLFTHLFFLVINIRIYLTVYIITPFIINKVHTRQVEKFLFMQINER